eukprot:COSAG01_NODE_2274_length_8021_cov_15.958218_3_plen_129_part_00
MPSAWAQGGGPNVLHIMTDGRVRARKYGSRGGPHGAAVVQGASGGAAGVSVGDSDTRKPNMGPGGLSTQGDPHSVASVLRQTPLTCPVDTPKCIPLGESLLLPPPLPPFHLSANDHTRFDSVWRFDMI